MPAIAYLAGLCKLELYSTHFTFRVKGGRWLGNPCDRVPQRVITALVSLRGLLSTDIRIHWRWKQPCISMITEFLSKLENKTIATLRGLIYTEHRLYRIVPRTERNDLETLRVIHHKLMFICWPYVSGSLYFFCIFLDFTYFFWLFLFFIGK